MICRDKVCLLMSCLAHSHPCELCALLTWTQALRRAPVLRRRLLCMRMHACILTQQHIAGVERIQVVCSMNPATTVGRQPLAPRLAALMHVASMSYPPSAQLQTIVSTLLARTLDKACLYCCLQCACCMPIRGRRTYQVPAASAYCCLALSLCSTAMQLTSCLNC